MTRIIEQLSRIPLQRRPDRLLFAGRILLLCEDPELIRRQLLGEDIPWSASVRLREDISTDEITPATICYHFDEKLGDYAYHGLKAGDSFPFREYFETHGRGGAREGRFAVSVSGRRRGKGSSREQSPYAEMVAGIQLVIGESIERIYKQNCQNLGLLTSTDLSLVQRIRRGDEIPLAEFTRGEDPITAEVIRFGGLFPFNVARLRGESRIPAIDTPRRPMTITEKILASHLVQHPASGRAGVEAVRPGDAGFVSTDLRFSHEYVTPMAAIFFETLLGPDAKANDPDSILFFRDHLTFLGRVMSPEARAAGLLDVADQLASKQAAFARRQGIRLHGEIPGGSGSEGICHSIVYERYALPGQVIVGSDSHTCQAGALGCVAFGAGTTDIFNAWITRDVRVRVPESILLRLVGRMPDGVTAKDLALEILRHPCVRSGEAIGKVLEYSGEAIQQMSLDERATLTNMAAEAGAFTGIVAPDEKTAEFLAGVRGLDLDEARRLCEPWHSDTDARYARIIEIDARTLRPMVALPGDPGQGVPITELPHRVKIDIAYGGSCTAGKREDMDMYARVLREGLARGRRVHEEVTFWIQFGSQDVRRYCEEMGYLELFQKAGARTIEPSCGACINAGPGVSTRRDQVTISAINRNFPGRSGPGTVYLASPLTVAASALAGEIAAHGTQGMDPP